MIADTTTYAASPMIAATASRNARSESTANSIVGATLYHKDRGKKLTVKYNTYHFVKCADESGSTALYTPEELTASPVPLAVLKNDLRADIDSPSPVRAWFKTPEDSNSDAYDLKTMLADILKRIESI